MGALAQNILAAMEDRMERARWYFQLREEYPREPASRIWRYIMAAQDDAVVLYVEFYCNHEWSSGYDDSDHEVAIYCQRCGAAEC